MGFKQTITRISDGTPVDAATTNPCLDDLQGNVLFLKALVDNISGGQALIRPSVAIKSDVVAGHALYWNGANSRYERAQADGTYRQDVAGVCLAVSATTVGDLLTAGFKALNITPVLQGVETLQAGRYYLSASAAGALTFTRPVSAIPVLIADALGNVLVLPQTGSRGYQGYIGNRGYQGWRGFQGIPTTTTAGGSASGATGDAYVTVYDSGTVPSGLLFAATIKNTGGANGLTYSVIATDAFGTTASAGANVAFGAGAILAGDGAVATATPPFTRVQIQVKSQSPGNPTNYSLRLTRTAG